jgi:RNase P/RNase MRP subunit POP5
MRFKRRYVSFVVFGDAEGISERDVRDYVHQSALSFFGEAGISSLSFKLAAYDAEKKSGVMRCSREKSDEMVACFALASPFPGKSARIMCTKTSGIIAKLPR